MTDKALEINETNPRTSSLRAWLELIRIPAVFTAIADIAVGFTLRNGGFEPVGIFASLVCASVGLYLSGMVLNDVFDRNRDALSRSGRPIPSGRIPVRHATCLGIVLVALGIASAWSVSWQAFYIACGLTLSILVYNGLAKETILGPLFMGSCRFLNVMLGTAIDDVAMSVWQVPHIIIAAAIGLYVVGVTWFARDEETLSQRWGLISGAVIVNLGLAMIAGVFYSGEEILGRDWLSRFDGLLLTCAVFAIALSINRNLIMAITHRTPQFVQGAVKLMLLSIIMIDATLVLAATGSLVSAMAIALMILPATLLGRWLYVT